MSAFNADDRKTFCDVLLLEAECYEKALQSAAELAEDCSRGQPPDERLQNVFAQLDRRNTHAEGIVDIRCRWEEAGRPRDNSLSALLERNASLIRQLQEKLQTIEQATRKRRDELMVELDVCNRRHQMQRAYQRKM
jgi:hypothetical protein